MEFLILIIMYTVLYSNSDEVISPDLGLILESQLICLTMINQLSTKHLNMCLTDEREFFAQGTERKVI